MEGKHGNIFTFKKGKQAVGALTLEGKQGNIFTFKKRYASRRNTGTLTLERTLEGKQGNIFTFKKR